MQQVVRPAALVLCDLPTHMGMSGDVGSSWFVCRDERGRERDRDREPRSERKRDRHEREAGEVDDRYTPAHPFSHFCFARCREWQPNKTFVFAFLGPNPARQ